MYGCEYAESRCGHVSIVWFEHNVQGWLEDAISMVSHVLDVVGFHVCVICVSDMLGANQKWFESLWSIWSFKTHLST